MLLCFYLETEYLLNTIFQLFGESLEDFFARYLFTTNVSGYVKSEESGNKIFLNMVGIYEGSKVQLLIY